MRGKVSRNTRHSGAISVVPYWCYSATTVPSINLRLSEQQHAELEVWAKDGHRSLQKEIIWRLFSAEGHGAPKIGPAVSEPRDGISVPPDGAFTNLTSHSFEDQIVPAPGKRRMHPCKHHLPPSKHCPYGCDG